VKGKHLHRSGCDLFHLIFFFCEGTEEIARNLELADSISKHESLEFEAGATVCNHSICWLDNFMNSTVDETRNTYELSEKVILLKEPIYSKGFDFTAVQMIMPRTNYIKYFCKIRNKPIYELKLMSRRMGLLRTFESYGKTHKARSVFLKVNDITS
jgi:hypothetical protein